MKITIFRKYKNKDDGVFGKLSLYNSQNELVFECWTLENIPRDTKVPGKTAIATGSYSVRFMKYNTPMQQQYKQKFDFHVGMLELQNVPDFEQIYIHIGNYVKDTDGCILVGRGFNLDKNMLTDSTLAYVELYNLLSEALQNGESVVLEIYQGVL